VGIIEVFLELDVGWENPSNPTFIMGDIAVPRKKKGQNSYPHKIDIPCNQFHDKSGKSPMFPQLQMNFLNLGISHQQRTWFSSRLLPQEIFQGQ
jgi:hypothetical protein